MTAWFVQTYTMLFGDKGRSATTSAEGRRREILAAAIHVIAEGGADAVTHRRVAAEARVPLGSLTYYFESREDLIREAFRFYIDEATAFLLEVEGDIPPTSVSDLADMIVEIMQREFMQPALIRAEYEMILHASRDEQVARAYAAWERGLEMRLAAPLESLGAARPIAAARTVLHLVRGFELEQLAHRTEEAGELHSRLVTVVNALIAPRRSETGGTTQPAGISDRSPRRSRAASTKRINKRRSNP